MKDFIEQFTELQDSVHQLAYFKGFWDAPNPGEKIALIHSELSELLEAYREANPQSKTIAGFTQAEEELADTVIRIMDFASYYNLRLIEAIIAKAKYNESRPRKHNKEF